MPHMIEAKGLHKQFREFMSVNNANIGNSTSVASVPFGGYPTLTVPVDYNEDGTLDGAVFVGGFLPEPQLLAVGYAYKQTVNARMAPDVEATMALIAEMNN